MKTTKEWFLGQPSEWRGATPQDWTAWLKAVQFDAWKQGMTDAAEIVANGAKEHVNAILDARETAKLFPI